LLSLNLNREEFFFEEEEIRVLRINIHLKGHLSYYQSEKREEVVLDVEAPVTLEEILAQLKIPVSEVEGAFFDGKWVPLSESLERGGKLDIMPIIGGG